MRSETRFLGRNWPGSCLESLIRADFTCKIVRRRVSWPPNGSCRRQPQNPSELEDLTFGGDYPASVWTECTIQGKTAWSTIDGWGVPETDDVVKFAKGCWQSSGNDIEVNEVIYVLGTQRQASRLAESIRADRYMLSMMDDASESTSSVRGNSVWIGQGEMIGPWQDSYIVIAVDKAVIFVRVVGSSRFIEEDLVEVVTATLTRLRRGPALECRKGSARGRLTSIAADAACAADQWRRKVKQPGFVQLRLPH